MPVPVGRSTKNLSLDVHQFFGISLKDHYSRNRQRGARWEFFYLMDPNVHIWLFFLKMTITILVSAFSANLWGDVTWVLADPPESPKLLVQNARFETCPVAVEDFCEDQKYEVLPRRSDQFPGPRRKHPDH